jgi:hypothetical protein
MLVLNGGGHGMTRVLMVPYDFAWDLQERHRGIDTHVFDRALTAIVDYYAPDQEYINCQIQCLLTALGVLSMCLWDLLEDKITKSGLYLNQISRGDC